jgi:hypothetical protein
MAPLPDRRTQANHAEAVRDESQPFAFIDGKVSGFVIYSFADSSLILAAAPSATGSTVAPTAPETVVFARLATDPYSESMVNLARLPQICHPINAFSGCVMICPIFEPPEMVDRSSALPVQQCYRP